MKWIKYATQPNSISSVRDIAMNTTDIVPVGEPPQTPQKMRELGFPKNFFQKSIAKEAKVSEKYDRDERHPDAPPDQIVNL